MALELEDRIEDLCNALNGRTANKRFFNRRVEYYEQINGRCLARIGVLSDLNKNCYMTRSGLAAVLGICSTYFDLFIKYYGHEFTTVLGKWRLVLYKLDDKLIKRLPKLPESIRRHYAKLRGQKVCMAKSSLGEKRLLERKYINNGWIEHKQIIDELKKYYPDINNVLGGHSEIAFHKEAGARFRVRRNYVECRKEDAEKVKEFILKFYYARKERTYLAGR